MNVRGRVLAAAIVSILMPACAAHKQADIPAVAAFPGTLILRWQDGVYGYRAGQTNPVKLAEMPSGSRVAGVSSDGVRLLTSDGQMVDLAAGTSTSLGVEDISEAAFSPDGRYVAALSGDPWQLVMADLRKDRMKPLGRGFCREYTELGTGKVEEVCSVAQGVAWIDESTLVFSRQSSLPASIIEQASGGPDTIAVMTPAGRTVREIESDAVVRELHGVTALFTDGMWAPVSELLSGELRPRTLPVPTEEFGDPTAWLTPDGGELLVAGAPWRVLTLDSGGIRPLGSSHEMVLHQDTAWAPDGSMFACSDLDAAVVVGVPLSADQGGALLRWPMGTWGQGGAELLAWQG